MSDSKLPEKEAEKPEETYNYEEVHSTPIADIIPDRQAKQAGDGEPVDSKPSEDGATPPADDKNTPPADETTPKDAEPVKPVETPAPSEPVDVEKLASETAKKTAEEMVKALTGDDATKKEKDELREKIESAAKEQPWVKENRNPSYAEMAGFLAKFTIEHSTATIKEQVKAELQREVEDETAQETEQKKTQETQDKAFHTKWDEEFKQLEGLGHKLDGPAKAKVFEIMRARVLNGKPTDSILTVFTEDYKPMMDEIEKKKNAPVGGVSHGGATVGGETYTYDQIHNVKTDDILQEVRK